MKTRKIEVARGGSPGITMSCQICLDDYKGRMKPVKCQYCPSNACRKCLERYLLQSYEDPCCMDCKRGWSSDFMAENFTLSFRTVTLRQHRRNILFEREKSMLPAMQVFAAARLRIRQLEKERIELNDNLHGKGSIGEKHSVVEAQYYTLHAEYSRKSLAIQELKALIAKNGPGDNAPLLAQARLDASDIKAKMKANREDNAETINTFKDRMRAINDNMTAQILASREYNGEAGAPVEKREFIMKCGANDCRGFLSTAYKCGTCESWTCPDCLVVLGKDKAVEHKCAQDAVDSAKMIRSETMPCPKCGTRIFKVDGCNQMWCIMEGCNTAFDWVSGRIVTGAVHNPHYYEWLRRQGNVQREAGDIPCGGVPGFWQLLSSFRTARIAPAESSDLERIHRMVVEMEGRLPDYPARMPQLINKDLNVAYLLKDIEEDEWKRRLEFTEAKFNRKREIGYILHTLVTAASDLMNQLVNRCNAAVTSELRIEAKVWIMETFMPQLNGLRNYTNQALKDLAIRNHMAVPQVSDEWAWIPIRALYKKKADAPPPLDTTAA
jgi:hypothetical protein